MPLYRMWTCSTCEADVLYYMPASADAYLVLDPVTRELHHCEEE